MGPLIMFVGTFGSPQQGNAHVSYCTSFDKNKIKQNQSNFHHWILIIVYKFDLFNQSISLQHVDCFVCLFTCHTCPLLGPMTFEFIVGPIRGCVHTCSNTLTNLVFLVCPFISRGKICMKNFPLAILFSLFYKIIKKIHN